MKLTTIKSLVAAALCAVGLSSFAAEPEAVQLWEGGPYWAECNIGATKPEDYGILTNFNDAAQAVTDALGNGWRLPTKAEFEALLANCGKGTWTEQNGAKGRLFTGTGDYSSNSIFLPAAGYVEGPGRKWAEYQGRYWSSGEVDGNLAWYLYFYDSDVRVYNYNRSWGFSVRAVRDTPLVTGPAVTVGGTAVGEVVRGEDGKTLSFAVAAGTVVGDVKLDIGGVDVTKGFRVTVNGTEARAVLLAPYEVPKEEGAADGIWTENGDGTVTLNVTVVPGLYYAADSAESIDALTCPGASAPATGATTLTAPKPVGDKGFFKVWVSDAPIPAAP